nr:hypothetical protein [Fodinicurvata sediminis]
MGHPHAVFTFQTGYIARQKKLQDLSAPIGQKLIGKQPATQDIVERDASTALEENSPPGWMETGRLPHGLETGNLLRPLNGLAESEVTKVARRTSGLPGNNGHDATPDGRREAWKYVRDLQIGLQIVRRTLLFN